jgi:hypothetical protein
MVNLWGDIMQAQYKDFSLLHLTAEPISVSEVSEAGFGIEFSNIFLDPPPAYDFQSLYATSMGSRDKYQYTKREVIQAIRTYAQSETRTGINMAPN